MASEELKANLQKNRLRDPLTAPPGSSALSLRPRELLKRPPQGGQAAPDHHGPPANPQHYYRSKDQLSQEGQHRLLQREWMYLMMYPRPTQLQQEIHRVLSLSRESSRPVHVLYQSEAMRETCRIDVIDPNVCHLLRGVLAIR